MQSTSSFFSHHLIFFQCYYNVALLKYKFGLKYLINRGKKHPLCEEEDLLVAITRAE